MAAILSGTVPKFFIFDVAETSLRCEIWRNRPRVPACHRSRRRPRTSSSGTRLSPSNGRAIGATPGGELIELVIVLILVLELALFFAGAMR